MTEHTQKPWIAIPNRDNYPAQDGAGHITIMNLYADGEEGWHLARVWNTGPNPEGDALLMAAASEMYAALEAVEWVPVEDPTGGTMFVCPWCWGRNINGHAPDCQRQAALRKARGEQ